MNLKAVLVGGAMSLSLLSQAMYAETAAPVMSDEQKKEIEKVVHDYLLNQPEILIEVSQKLQKKQQEAMQEKAQKAISENGKALFDGKMTTLGNPKGQVTVVEFFDYQCGHCKHMSSIMDDVINKDSNVRVIYKEFPIFGASSEMASKMALAAAMQGKYQQMHQALFKADKKFDDKMLMEIAKSVGLDMNKLKKDMDSKEVTDILAANRKLAEDMSLSGTPAFVVASTPNGEFKSGAEAAFFPGAISEEILQEQIKKAAGN